MALEPVDLVRVILSFGSLALIIFTIGTHVGWRVASPADRELPTWLFFLSELSWLPIIGVQFLLEHPPGWEWTRWLAPTALGLWAVAFALRVRHRRRRSAQRSDGEAS